MNILLLAALVLSPWASRADVISCNFTEPFYTLTYDTGTKLLRVDLYGGEKKVLKNIGFLIRGPGQFELRKDNQPYMTLNLTNKGSDGMSDYQYPYEAKVVGQEDDADLGIGGCESLVLKKTKSGD